MQFTGNFSLTLSIHVAWHENYAGQSTETQMNTQLLFGIQVNKQMVKLGKYFADFNFRGSRLTTK